MSPKRTSKHKDGLNPAKKMKADTFLTEDGQKAFEKEVNDLANKDTKKIDEAAAKKVDMMMV